MAKNWGVNPPMHDEDGAPPRVSPNPAKTLGVNRESLPRERGGTGVKDRLPPPMLPAIAGHGLDPPYAPPPGAALDDPPSPDPPHLRSARRARRPPEIVKTANPELFNQLLGGKWCAGSLRRRKKKSAHKCHSDSLAWIEHHDARRNRPATLITHITVKRATPTVPTLTINRRLYAAGARRRR